MRPDDRRVVVSGMGVVSTLGMNPRAFIDNLLAGRSGITRWRQQDERNYSKIGGDLSGFDVAAYFAREVQAFGTEWRTRAARLLRATPLGGLMTAAAAAQAFAAAGLADGAVPADDIGIVLGAHNVNDAYSFVNSRQYDEEPEFIEPLYGLYAFDTDPLAVTAELLGLGGPISTVGGACASGNTALISAMDLLLAGRAHAVVAAAVSTDLSPAMLQGLGIMEALSIASFNDEPARASRPFDKLREGFVPSEGAACVVLETLASAKARGAPIRAELLGGMSASSKCRHARSSQADQVRTMRGALQAAGVRPEDIDYISAHGTSTGHGDATEVRAIKEVFGAHARRIPVNSAKSMLGHCLQAAGLLEFIATILQMEAGQVHPTINQEVPDPELDLDFVANHARPHAIRTAASNSFGFGGINTCVIVGAKP